jgi:glutathione S-transferase
VYPLHITPKNTSPWPLHPWLLMRNLGIPFAEHLQPFPQAQVAAVGDVVADVRTALR